MPIRKLLRFNTRKGPVFIVYNTGIQRYQIIWGDEPLGSYATIASAVDDAAGGHTFTPADGTDLGALGISCDPSEWQRCG